LILTILQRRKKHKMWSFWVEVNLWRFFFIICLY